MRKRRKTGRAMYIPSGLQTEFSGDTQVSFEDSGGVEILEYDTETVRIRGGKLCVRLYGASLELGKIAPRCVMIRGKIKSMEFE